VFEVQRGRERTDWGEGEDIVPSQLLTIADLAARWQCPVSVAKATVTFDEIPYATRRR
jgi:hypothetical protein